MGLDIVAYTLDLPNALNQVVCHEVVIIAVRLVK